ncbi:MAG: aldo/keto reductase [Candidatus Sedimenticola sp. 20ELBAFRAG]
MKRRQFLGLLGAGVGVLASGTISAANQTGLLRKAIPSSGERIPAVGMGSSITFNVGSDPAARDQRSAVLGAFFKQGGGLIDSSPMYGSSEAVIGHGLGRQSDVSGLFSATKVWTSAGEDGPSEIEASRRLWGVKRFDLLQVHNLLAWEEHLETLLSMKEQGRVRYVGITTSHGRRHSDLEEIMKDRPIDFIQASYNILDRELEQRILPLAVERGIAVIANRPYRRGGLIDHVKRYPLPGWAREFDCTDWAGFLLKFIISHPAVTCAIPATSRVDHMLENIGAMHGRLPEPDMRRRMSAYIEAL